MSLYGGCDLHATNNYWGVIDGDGKRVLKKKLENDPEVILRVLKSYQDDLVGIVVESAFKRIWHWRVG